MTRRRREATGEESVWSNRFLKSAIAQGAIITGLTIVFVLGQMMYSSRAINIIQFLSLSFEGPAKWIFLGYIFYMILVVAIATTALFYNHFEVNMGRSIHGLKSVLAWIHLIGMNVGGTSVTIAMIIAGMMGSGILDMIASGTDAVTELKPNTSIMVQFISPVSVFAAILVMGVIAGGLMFITSYLEKDNLEDRRLSLYKTEKNQ